MKVSLQIRDGGHDHDQQHQPHQHQKQRKPLLRAKVPVTVLGLPFTSGVVAGDPSDLSFSLQTNFLSGPSLKLSYTPSSSSSSTSSSSSFALSLKSGAGLFGSPNDSPLTISARFSLLPNSFNPSFSLHLKPRFGDFSLTKTASSPNPNPNPNPPNSPSSFNLPQNPATADTNFEMPENADNGLGSFEMLDSNLHPTVSNLPSASGAGLAWGDLKKMDSCCGKGGILSGFSVRARTVLPLMRGVDVNFRWGVNFPAQESGNKLPFLTVHKIRFETRSGRRRAEDGKEGPSAKKNNCADTELLKGMCFWMSRDLEALQKENREMKQCLQEMRLGVPASDCGSRENDGAAVKKSKPSSADNSSEFEPWRVRKNGGQENGGSKSNKASNMESELQRAIQAASI